MCKVAANTQGRQGGNWVDKEVTWPISPPKNWLSFNYLQWVGAALYLCLSQNLRPHSKISCPSSFTKGPLFALSTPKRARKDWGRKCRAWDNGLVISQCLSILVVNPQYHKPAPFHHHLYGWYVYPVMGVVYGIELEVSLNVRTPRSSKISQF